MRKLTPRKLLVVAGLAVVTLIVIITRFAGGGGGVAVQTSDSQRTPTIATSATGTPTAPGEPLVVDPGHGEPGPSGTPRPAPTEAPPVLVRPTDPTVREAAAAFTAAWLNTFGKTPPQWRDGMRPHVTDDLAADLAYADPATVPTGVVGSPINVSAEGSLWNTGVPVLDAPRGKPVGTADLTLVRHGDRWLVSEIDWTPR